eukprot:3632540-Amphidinium_carterae.1
MSFATYSRPSDAQDPLSWIYNGTSDITAMPMFMALKPPRPTKNAIKMLVPVQTHPNTHMERHASIPTCGDSTEMYARCKV